MKKNFFKRFLQKNSGIRLICFLPLFFMCAASCAENSGEAKGENAMKEKLIIEIENSEGLKTELTASLVDNEATRTLVQKLKEKPVSIKLIPYGGFEVYGKFDFKLPVNDQSITTRCGDIVLAWGNTISINYGENTYNFTRLGFLDDVKNGRLNSSALKKILGNGNCNARIRIK